MVLGSQEEHEWGANANCYAYAFYCRSPANGNQGGAVPGGVAGAPVHLKNESFDSYCDRLRQGVLADAKENKVLVEIVNSTPQHTPPDVENTYLVAMLNGKGGFHFLRRDGFTDRWSWKDGNGDTVKLNVYDPRNAMYVYINKSNFADLVSGKKMLWNYNSMTFNTFFRVARGGMRVQR